MRLESLSGVAIDASRSPRLSFEAPASSTFCFLADGIECHDFLCSFFLLFQIASICQSSELVKQAFKRAASWSQWKTLAISFSGVHFDLRRV